MKTLRIAHQSCTAATILGLQVLRRWWQVWLTRGTQQGCCTGAGHRTKGPPATEEQEQASASSGDRYKALAAGTAQGRPNNEAVHPTTASVCREAVPVSLQTILVTHSERGHHELGNKQQYEQAAAAPPAVTAPRRETPTIKGLDAGANYIREGLGAPGFTWRMLRTAAERREVAVFMIGGAYWFSEQGLYEWVMSRREGGVGA